MKHTLSKPVDISGSKHCWKLCSSPAVISMQFEAGGIGYQLLNSSMLPTDTAAFLTTAYHLNNGISIIRACAERN